MRDLVERLQRLGSPGGRKLVAQAFGTKVRDLTGWLAMALVDQKEPAHELIQQDVRVKGATKKAVQALRGLVDAIAGSDGYIDVTPGLRKVEGILDAPAWDALMERVEAVEVEDDA